MPYITREDGERFVIPSYRDVLTAAQPNQLKKEIQTLSQSYGEFVALQKKGPTQYEVAFSQETGYLLGETVWHQFNKPLDLIYCEAIPNTTEAILVIVKSGIVYLDGSFPIDSIPEELVVFLTQQNSFEIFIYGDVPISKEPETGKFNFEANSVKSFSILPQPIFSTLPLLKTYRLQLVDVVLKAQGIGVSPLKPIAALIVLLLIGVAVWYQFFREKEVVVTPEAQQINPYQAYNTALSSPAPADQITNFVNKLTGFYQIPGWKFKEVKFIHNKITASVLSNGGKVADLYAWTDVKNVTVEMKPDGLYITDTIPSTNRPIPKTITPIDKLIGLLVDRIAKVYPGNHLEISDIMKKGVYNQVNIQLRFDKITPALLNLIGQQFTGLPLVFHSITLSQDADGNLTGSLIIEALGK